jgi:uncharacterized protein
MNNPLYTASVPVFIQMLGGLKAVLAKATAHAAAKNIAPEVLLHARLFPDMFHMMRQVQIACDFAKGTACRLAGQAVPAMADTETSFAELEARIDTVLALLAALPVAQFDGAETREIVTQAGTPREKKFMGTSYVFNYGLPHFFFHVTTAYNILRHNGVELSKKDYIGTYE